jgi:hypothetical protein
MKGLLIATVAGAGIAAICLTMAVSAGAAIAPLGRSYTGNWPLTVSHSKNANGTYCLTLTDGGYLGWRHSGGASLVTFYGSKLTGTFQLIDHTLVATITQPGEGSQNAGLVFAAPDSGHGTIGRQGVYEQVYGGGEFDSGVLIVGMKGGC